jgi:uncharacterized C2H2 Zn-finger protein
MKENVNLRCPNCKTVLKNYTDIKDIFKCPREDIVWKLTDKDNGKFLEMLHAPGGYKGVMIARLGA